MVTERSGGRERLDEFWVAWMRGRFANEPDLSPKAIQWQAEELVRTQLEGAIPPSPPAPSTVYKYAQQFRELPEHVRNSYRPFRWPHSMEQGLLPWEATAAAMELFTWSQEQGLWAPPISLTLWFYRISLAIPQAPIGERLRVAQTVACYREAGKDVPDEVVQLLASPSLRKEHHSDISTGGPTAAWATQFLWNRSARDALYAA